jgi:hypothetical protein
MQFNPNASLGSWKGVDQIDGKKIYRLPMFEVALTPLHQNAGGAHLTVGLLATPKAQQQGNFTETSFHLVPAIMAYNISINNGHVTINSQESQTAAIDRANNTEGLRWLRKPRRIQPGTLDT